MGETSFWDNQEAAKAVVAELKTLKTVVDPMQALLAGIDDTRALYQLATEAGDADSLEEAVKMAASCPNIKYGGNVEVRPVMPIDNDPQSTSFLNVQ